MFLKYRKTSSNIPKLQLQALKLAKDYISFEVDHGIIMHYEIFKKTLHFSNFYGSLSVKYNTIIIYYNNLYFIRNSETDELTYSNFFPSLLWESVSRYRCCSNHGSNSTDGLFSFGGRLRHIIFRVYHWRSLINRDISLLTGLE